MSTPEPETPPTPEPETPEPAPTTEFQHLKELLESFDGRIKKIEEHFRQVLHVEL